MTPWQVLRAKLLVQVLVTGIPMAVTSVLILLAVRPALPLALLLIALPQAFVWLSAAFWPDHGPEAPQPGLDQ